ncbi:MAG: phage tail tape measure C-terminal domain-containing protein, partial [Rhodospirillaceae bacterium]
MTVKLGARIEADVSPLVEALATAGQALDQFEGRVQAANDELTQIGDAGAASLGSLAGGAGQAADALAPLGAAAEAVRSVAAAANDSEAGIASFADAGSTASAALTSLFEIANDNRGFAGITAATGETADGLERLGGTGSAALAMLVQPAAEAETAVAGLAPVADGAGQALAELLSTAGNTEGLDRFAQATGEVGAALAGLTAGDEGFARDLAANQQQLSALATARTEIAQTLRDADQENADASQGILDQANRIAEDGFAARVELERQFWQDNQVIEEAGGRTALEVMTSALSEQNAVMAEELAKRNQTAREQAAELRTTLDDSFKEYLAPAVGLADDTQANNAQIIPVAGARLNAALEAADYGSVNETWQEVVTRFVSDGLDKLQEAGTRAFGTLRHQGAAAFDELAAGTTTAETAATAFGAALDGIGDAAGAALAELGSLVSGGVKEAEHELTAAGTAATAAGHQIEAAGSGGAAMGHAVAEGAKAGTDALNEVARLGEDVAIGMAARAGTIGQALRGLGPIGLGAAAAIGALWLAFDDAKKAEQELTDLNQALTRTGATATMTAHDVQALADSLATSTMASRDEVLKAETELMQFGSVLGDSFERTLRLAADLSAAFGGTLSANVKLLGSALNEPEQALESLEQAGVRFTDAQRDLIQGLVDSGRQFEAQQAILEAVGGAVGGADASARSGLTGKVKVLTDAWQAFVAEFTSSDNLIGQAASSILGTLAWLVDGATRMLGHSVDDQITKLQTERDALTAQIASGDYGFQGFLGGLLGTTDRAAAEAKARLEDLNRTLSDLQARQRQQDLADEIAAEDRQSAVREQQARVVADKLEEIDQDLDDRLQGLAETRVDKIRAEAEAKIKLLEGLKAEAAGLGRDTADYDAAILKVQQWQIAEEAAAEAKSRSSQATRDALDPNEKLIESLSHELEVIELSDREQAVDAALRRLSADATDAQKDKVRELAGALFDEKEAAEAASQAEEVLDHLRQKLAELNMSAGDRAAAEAVRQLGENASEADRAMAELLAHQIQDGKDAKSVIDATKDAAEKYAEQLEKLNHLLEVGAIDHTTYGKAAAAAYQQMTAASRDWQDGLQSSWAKYVSNATNSAAQVSRVFNDAMSGMEDVFVKFITTGELNFDNLTQRIVEDLARIFWEREIVAPIGTALFGNGQNGGGGDSGGGGLFGSLFSGDWFSGLFHEGGVAGEASTYREMPSWMFAGAPHYHSGGIAGLAPGEV